MLNAHAIDPIFGAIVQRAQASRKAARKRREEGRRRRQCSAYSRQDRGSQGRGPEPKRTPHRSPRSNNPRPVCSSSPPLQQYFELRSRQIQKLRETQNPNPYPHKFDVSISVVSYINKYGEEGLIEPGSKLEGQVEMLAGRVHNIRAAGQKLRFYDLHGEGHKVQIMATQQ